MPNSVYIHIPFCKSKCKYCAFISFPVKNENEKKGYAYSLLKEISENYRGERLNTLYFGGGTPSLMPVDLLSKIINKFNISSDTEVTLEINPDDSNEDYLEELKHIGINRISIGSQTFNDEILAKIGRRHNSKQIIETINHAKKAGFKNISVDLIYGLPNQTTETLKEDLEKFLELEIQHISTYGLKIEDNSFWGKNRPDNIPDDDMQADFYELINDILEKNEFYRYEISNFAQKGFESKHNLNYWNNEEYYGFGLSAHGYVDGVRYSNFSTMDKYMQNPSVHEFGNFLTNQEKLEEEIFLGFRKREGIDIKKIKEKFDIDFETKYKKILDKYQEFLEKTQNGYTLNLKGVLISNVILAEFLE